MKAHTLPHALSLQPHHLAQKDPLEGLAKLNYSTHTSGSHTTKVWYSVFSPETSPGPGSTHLIPTELSILLFSPRAARLRACL